MELFEEVAKEATEGWLQTIPREMVSDKSDKWSFGGASVMCSPRFAMWHVDADPKNGCRYESL